MAGKGKSRKLTNHNGSGKEHYKSAITGRYVTKGYGKSHPRTTYKTR